MEEAMPWNEGEEMMHRLRHIPMTDNPSTPFLFPQAARHVQQFPLMALGVLDAAGRPWTSVWGGEVPLASVVGPSILGVRAIVDGTFDPVIHEVFAGKADGEVVRDEAGMNGHGGRMISAVSINLEQRNRIKLFGRMVAGSLGKIDPGPPHGQDPPGAVSQVQLVFRIEECLYNCPKYLNRKHIYPAIPAPKLVSDSVQLPPEALNLLEKADLFFISSSDADRDMDSNHRGGPQGFVRVQSNDPSGAVLVWPEYSGNNLYQTLGNLQISPRAGLAVPDFDTGDVLYVTGDTEVLSGKEASAVLAHSNLLVRLKVTAAKFVSSGLAFKGEEGERSPYNPRVKYLVSEKMDADVGLGDDKSVTAKLIKKERLTPTINRYRFAISDPLVFGPWKPGQYAALSFQDELDMGYSHMRDDDPTSLNDDFLRTFTVSSRYGQGLHGEEFEMTIRKVGRVTEYLAHQNDRSGFEVPLRGFAGDFKLEQKKEGILPFVAAGIGITPLLAQLADIDVARLRLIWSVQVKDIGLVLDTFERHKDLAKSTTLFLTGRPDSLPKAEKIKLRNVLNSGAMTEMRRLKAEDLTVIFDQVDEIYLCTAPAVRKAIQEWLPQTKIIFENFNY